jgi:hypothetical protein
MNEIIKPPTGGTPVQGRRLDVKALMDHHLAALNKFALAASRTTAIIRTSAFEFLAQRNVNGELYYLTTLKAGGAEAERIRKNALAIWPRLPPTERLIKALDVTTAALNEPVDEPTIRLMIGVMLDGLRVKIDDRSAISVEALRYMIDEEDIVISATVMAAAVRHAWRTVTFPPSITEFLQFCRERRTAVWVLHNDINGILDYREGVEELPIFTGDLAPPDDGFDDVESFDDEERP